MDQQPAKLASRISRHSNEKKEFQIQVQVACVRACLRACFAFESLLPNEKKNGRLGVLNAVSLCFLLHPAALTAVLSHNTTTC